MAKEKNLYLFFDHEWRYQHCEVFNKKDYDLSNDGSSMQHTFDFYQKENFENKHDWFLNELLNDQKVIKQKLSLVLMLNKADKNICDSVNSLIDDKKNLINDGCGNYLLKIKLPEQLANDVGHDLKILSSMDWSHNTGKLFDCEKICKDNEKTLIDIKLGFANEKPKGLEL